ncbi:MAG: hypothetical protein PHP63_08290 [Candidatus Marinimicrobia bacterium]|nr:hypothetical protein [Candidatus Neomarinimicrobiota bacterium]
MNSSKSRFVVVFLTLVGLGLVLAGLAMEQYLISLLGLAVLLFLLVQRGWQIRKLNKQIKILKEVKHDHNHSQDL